MRNVNEIEMNLIGGCGDPDFSNVQSGSTTTSPDFSNVESGVTTTSPASDLGDHIIDCFGGGSGCMP